MKVFLQQRFVHIYNIRMFSLLHTCVKQWNNGNENPFLLCVFSSSEHAHLSQCEGLIRVYVLIFIMAFSLRGLKPTSPLALFKRLWIERTETNELRQKRSTCLEYSLLYDIRVSSAVTQCSLLHLLRGRVSLNVQYFKEAEHGRFWLFLQV